MDYKALLLKYVDLKGLLVDGLLKAVVEVKLKELAADTSNSIDDALVAFLMPELEAAAVKWITAELAKIGV